MYVRLVLVCVIAKERRTNYDARFLTGGREWRRTLIQISRAA